MYPSPHSPSTGYQSSLPSPRAITDTIMREGVQVGAIITIIIEVVTTSAVTISPPPQNDTESERNTHMLMQWGQVRALAVGWSTWKIHNV